jgi:hypothetical protein
LAEDADGLADEDELRELLTVPLSDAAEFTFLVVVSTRLRPEE